jgi:hypothetical protein
MTGHHALHDEMQALLRRARCHYGNTLRDQEAGRSVEQAAHHRHVEITRIRELRAAVARACNGERSAIPAHAGHEDGVLRALLHFRGEMSEELAQHIHGRLAALKAEFLPDLKPEPLRCHVVKDDSRPTPRAVVSHERACECGYIHAGECW